MKEKLCIMNIACADPELGDPVDHLVQLLAGQPVDVELAVVDVAVHGFVGHR